MPNLPKISMNSKWIFATVVTTVIVVAILLAVYYPSIPDPMPVHWNAAGQADSWEPKTLSKFLFNILLGPVILLLSMMMAMGMLSMQSEYVTGPGGAKTENEAHRTWWDYKNTIKHLGWFMFALNLLIMLMMFRTYGAEPNRFELPIFLVLILALVVIFAWIIIKEQKKIEKKYPMPVEEQGKTWGIFYKDPDDKRILVATGSGTNFTFNIGRVGGKIGAIIVFGFPLVLVLWVIYMSFSS